MSDQENTSGVIAERVSPVVMVKSVSSKRSAPLKPKEPQDTVSTRELYQKSSVPEKLKQENVHVDNDQLESEHGIASERHIHVARKLSSDIPSNKRESTPTVSIPMAPIETEPKKSSVMMAGPTSTVTPIPDVESKIDTLKEQTDLESVMSEITELRTPEPKRTVEWTDEERAGGLPRSESRTSRESRVSRATRAVRQMFCCGVQLEAPSEDNISSPREGFFRSAI